MHRTEEFDERLFSAHLGNICIRARAGGYPSRCAPELDRPDPLPAKAAIDVPLALTIVGLGIVIVIAPSSVPGLTPPM